jgi:Mn-dependent DtxR family transcriptional regulator
MAKLIKYIETDYHYKVIEILKEQQYAGTWAIAHKIKIKTPLCLQLMKALEKNGIVKRSEHYSNINSIVWQLIKDRDYD